MKDKRQTSSTKQAAGNVTAESEAPARKGGGVIGGLALIIALGASAVSAFLYTELQKYRSQTNSMVESSTSELKSGMQTDIDGVKSEMSGLNSQLESQFSGLTTQLETEVTGLNTEMETRLSSLNSELEFKLTGLDTKIQDISGKVDSTSSDFGTKLQTLGSELDAKTQAAFTELADNTASAVQELTGKTETEIGTLAGKVTEQDEALQQSLQEEFDGKLGAVNETLSSLSNELVETRKLATKGQRDWILAEVEYLLRTGGHRVNLAGDTKSAVLALRAASDRLHDLGDSRFSPVREQISEEVAELRQVGTPDIEGVAFELEKLSKRADTLPLPPGPVEKAVEQVRVEPTEANAKAVADQLLQSLRELIKVENSDGTPLVRPGKPTRKQLTASEALRLNLQAARLSALRRDQGTFIIHMESAENYVRDVYHQEDEITKAYLEDLAVLKAQKIVPSVSKLGQALIMFNEIHSKRGEN